MIKGYPVVDAPLGLRARQGAGTAPQKAELISRDVQPISGDLYLGEVTTAVKIHRL